MARDEFPAGGEFEVREPLMLISVRESYYYRDNVYDAVRYAWKVNPERAESFNLVLANLRGVVVGVFRPHQWLCATRENFPGLSDKDEPGRWGFVGKEAEPATWKLYYGKRVPARYRRRGAQSLVRYCHPSDR